MIARQIMMLPGTVTRHNTMEITDVITETENGAGTSSHKSLTKAISPAAVFATYIFVVSKDAAGAN